MNKLFVLIIVLLCMPFVIAEGEDVLTYDRFQILMVSHQNQISQIIDGKYDLYEQYSNEAVADVKKQIDHYVAIIISKLVIGLLASFIFGAVLILLFVNWYYRKLFRSRWSDNGNKK